ncbi:MAG: hypothetical protein ACLQJ0_04545 [Steroidobacteraceae bacterium]
MTTTAGAGTLLEPRKSGIPMIESRAELIVDIAKRFMELLLQLEPQWKKGYLRFRLDLEQCGCNASFDNDSQVLLIDAIKNQGFFAHISAQGRKILQNLGKSKGVFILVADSSSKYDFYFEFEDLDRWKISQTDGATGVPIGITE